MIWSAENLRREAAQLEEIARSISLIPDRTALFERARAFRQEADRLEAQAPSCKAPQESAPAEPRSFRVAA